MSKDIKNFMQLWLEAWLSCLAIEGIIVTLCGIALMRDELSGGLPTFMLVIYTFTGGFIFLSFIHTLADFSKMDERAHQFWAGKRAYIDFPLWWRTSFEKIQWYTNENIPS